MTQNKTKKKSANSLIKKLGLIIIGLFLLYVIAGFWVVPPLLKPKLENLLSDQLGRKVTIEELKINPLALSSTITGLTVYEKGGAPFAGFQEFLVNAELSSILRWAVTFKEIRLLAPFGVLQLLPDKTLNISDIIAKFSEPEPAPEEEEETGLPRAVISILQVADGKFTYENLSGAKPIKETFAPIAFTLTDLSTLVEREGAFKFVGIGPLGGNYQLDGQISVNPVRVQGSYSTTDTDISELWKHIEDQVSFQIIKGQTATSGNYLIEMIDDTLHARLQDGFLEIKDFQLTEKGKDKVLISIPSFSVQGVGADVAAREIVVEQVQTAGARIESWLAPDGILNLQSLFRPDLKKSTEEEEPSAAEPKPAAGNPWQATIQKIEMDDWGAAFEDRTLPKPVRFTAEGLTVRIENLANKQDSKAEVALALQIKEVGTVKVDGSISLAPLSADLEISADNFALKSFQPYVDTAANAGIASGIISSKGRILYQDKDGTPQINFQNGAFELKDFELTEKGQDQVLVSIPSVTVQGISADVAAREIVVEQVHTADGRIESWIAPDGTVNLQNLILPDSHKALEERKSDSTELKEEKKSDPAEPEKADGSAWHATIHKIMVDKWGAAIEDRTLPKPVSITVDDLTAKIENLATKENSKAKVVLALQINRAGTVKVDGSAGITPLSADLTVLSDKIALKSFQPYVDMAVKAQIESGTTSSKGRVLYQAKDGQPQISYQGELSIDDVKIKDRIQSGDFISQKQIKASGIAMDINPNKLQVADILIDKTHASVTIDQNGTVNVIQAFTPIPEKEEKGKENLLKQVVNFLILQVQGPMPMAIDEIRLKDIAVDFIDESITPPYKTHLEISEGMMKGMSSEPAARADYRIEGTIDQSATIKSAGQMNPLNAKQYAKTDFSLNDFMLKPVSPYSGKYVGYKIADGKLNLKLKYHVDNSKFTGDNQIIINQLELGDKVDSPDATDLPVALTVTVLKGASGVITLQVPVSGDVNDPQFDFGQAILSALTGVVKDVSPPPASASADSSQSPTATDSSQASTATDSSQPATTTGSSPSSPPPTIKPITGAELRFVEFEFGQAELSARAMKKLDVLAKFLNKTPALALGIEGTADRQMDRTMDQATDDNQLKILAQKRADKVKDYLIQKGKVAEKRLRLKPAKIVSTTNNAHGRVDLYLSMH